MKFQQITNINNKIDSIVPCKKEDLSFLKEITNVSKIDFDGSFLTHHVFYNKNGTKIYAVGLGDEKQAVKLEETFRKFYVDTHQFWDNTIQLFAENLDENAIIKAAIGLELGKYQIGAFKTENENVKEHQIQFIATKSISKNIEEGQLIGQTINSIKSLVDAPPNIKTPQYLGNWALESAKKSAYTCTIFTKTELEKQGFYAVLAVGQGSINEPVVIVTEYKPKNTNVIDLALVGKGITFDSGGLSIKPSTNLHYMKSDMGGAAVVLGVVELVAKLQLNINLIGVVAAAENAVDANSYRPGDVIKSYSGKTIEIIDTDAEGRLVLADALSFAIKKYNPTYIIDLATLTGSVVRTFGYAAAGMFTENQEMAKIMSDIGYTINERVWQLPLFEDYEADLQSDVADIKNFNGKPIEGAINAAKFLEFFTNKHPNWMHLDIAGVSFGSSSYAKMKSATGFGIQLITNYAKFLANK
jgi:leucyl aminopeptidase